MESNVWKILINATSGNSEKDIWRKKHNYQANEYAINEIYARWFTSRENESTSSTFWRSEEKERNKNSTGNCIYRSESTLTIATHTYFRKSNNWIIDRLLKERIGVVGDHVDILSDAFWSSHDREISMIDRNSHVENDEYFPDNSWKQFSCFRAFYWWIDRHRIGEAFEIVEYRRLFHHYRVNIEGICRISKRFSPRRNCGEKKAMKISINIGLGILLDRWRKKHFFRTRFNEKLRMIRC